MTFTKEEEETLKLMVAETRTRIKLNKVNQNMGDKIRAEFSKIDNKIREEEKINYLPLQEELTNIEKNFKEIIK